MSIENNSNAEMSLEQKQAAWEAETKKLATEIGDSLGLGLDKGAVEPSAGLVLNGYNTTSSCEGHLDRGRGPYLQIEGREAKLMDSAIQQFWEDAGIPDPEDQYTSRLNETQRLELDRLWDKRENLSESILSEINELLEDFHKEYRGNFVADTLESDIRIAPVDIFEHDDKTPEEKELKLKEWQDELKAFGEFLKARYMNS